MKENPVREGAAWVAHRSRRVRLVPEGLEILAEELFSLPDPAWVERYHYRGEEELTLRYLWVLDALNFCFWPPLGYLEGWETSDKWSVGGPQGERLTGYYALSYALARVAKKEPEFFSADCLVQLRPEELRERLGAIPLLSWRVVAAREVGFVLRRFGTAQHFFSRAQRSAQKCVELITAHLPLFRDAAVYAGRWVPFLKRAQILVADIWGTFGGQGPGEFWDMPWLTAFADYKLPQILWAKGALWLHPQLAERIKGGELLPRGSPEEVELRAAAVVAVEELRVLLAQGGRKLSSFQVDWLLWNIAQGSLPVPHHRTLTWAY